MAKPSRSPRPPLRFLPSYPIPRTLVPVDPELSRSGSHSDLVRFGLDDDPLLAWPRYYVDASPESSLVSKARRSSFVSDLILALFSQDTANCLNGNLSGSVELRPIGPWLVTSLVDVPPSASPLILTMAAGFFIDRTRWRRYLNIVTAIIGIVGFFILISILNPKVHYAGRFFRAIGIYPTIPNTLS